MAGLTISTNGDYQLARAGLPVSLTEARGIEGDRDGLALADIAIGNGRIESIVASAAAPAAGAIDLGGRMIFPAFVDCHTHIDKGHIWPRKRNPDGSFMGALNATGEDRAARWNAALSSGVGFDRSAGFITSSSQSASPPRRTYRCSYPSARRNTQPCAAWAPSDE